MTADLGWTSLAVSFIAGTLSTLSPCVLPLLPLVLAPAAGAHRRGILALTGGLVLSFVTIGLFVATVGFSLGLDGEVFRKVSAVILALLGLVLISEPLQVRLASATGGISNYGQALLNRLSPDGLWGQFVIGLVLGAIWSPCVGPTLGAASVLAAQGKDLPMVALIMILFGIGAAVPVLIIGSLSRQALQQMRGGLAKIGKFGKYALGGLMLLIAVSILTGVDHLLEAWLLSVVPAGITNLTTRF